MAGTPAQLKLAPLLPHGRGRVCGVMGWTCSEPWIRTVRKVRWDPGGPREHTGQQGGSNPDGDETESLPPHGITQALLVASTQPSTYILMPIVCPHLVVRCPCRPARDLAMTGTGVSQATVFPPSPCSVRRLAWLQGAAALHSPTGSETWGEKRQECDAVPHAPPSLVRGAQYASGITTTPPFIPLPVRGRSMPVGATGKARPTPPPTVWHNPELHFSVSACGPCTQQVRRPRRTRQVAEPLTPPRPRPPPTSHPGTAPARMMPR